MNSVIIPVAPDYNSMSLNEVVRRREVVMHNINDEVKALNRQFRKEPLMLDTDRIEGLFNELKDINKSIEIKRATFGGDGERRGCCGIRNVKNLTWVTIGVQFLIAALLGAGEVANFIITQKVDDQISDLEHTCNTTLPTTEVSAIRSLGIARIVVVVIAAGLLVPLVGAIKDIDSDRDKAHLLMQISQIKEQGNEIRDFLASFKKFKRDTSPESHTPGEEMQDSLAHCVRCLDHLPEEGFREHIPSKDHWISLMVQLLPEDHPIKLQLMEMRDAALSKAKPKSSKPISVSTSSDLASLKSDEEYDDKSFESSPSPRRKFRGEKMAMPKLGSKLIESDSESLDIIDHKFQRRWKSLEKKLGTTLNCIQFGDEFALNRNAAIAPHISHFGATIPGENDEEEESSTDGRHEVRIQFSDV